MNARNHHERPVTAGDIAAVCVLLATMTLLGLMVALEWSWQ